MLLFQKGLMRHQTQLGKWEQGNKPTLLVMVLHCDDLPPCGSGTGQNGGGVQGLDGKWVDYANVFSCKLRFMLFRLLFALENFDLLLFFFFLCEFTFTFKRIISSQSFMKSDTSSNHSHHIAVRLAYNLEAIQSMSANIK